MARPKKKAQDEGPTQSLTVRFPLDVYRGAVEAADIDERSLNTWIVRAVREALDRAARVPTKERAK